MYCGAGTGCWARRATGGVDWFACPSVDCAPIVNKAKRSRQVFTNELRNCIPRSPVEEFLRPIKQERVRILSLSARKRQVGPSLWSRIMIISQLFTGDVFHLAFANKDTRHFQRRVG